MQLLLDDRLTPITSKIGFLEADLAVVVDRYIQWKRNASYIKKGRYQLQKRPISGNLETAMRSLLPLTTYLSQRRVLGQLILTMAGEAPILFQRFHILLNKSRVEALL
jgi:hypothetical protein